jgi:membrane AbrB-like protein
MTARDRPSKFAAVWTIAIGCLGAAIFSSIGFPAAVLTGSAFAVTVASVLGVHTTIPNRLRDICFLVLGISIGSTVTPEVIAGARIWPLSLIVLTGVVLATLLCLRAILRRWFGFDGMTSLLAATPGHMSYIVSMSASLKVDLPSVALAQSVRVLLLTLVVPLVIGLSGAAGDVVPKTVVVLGVVPMFVLFGIAVILGQIYRRIAVPAALLIAGITVSAVGHGTDLTPGTLPFWMTAAAFIVMGSLIGTRFNAVRGETVLKGVLAGVIGTALACIFAGAGAFVGAQIVDIPPAALLLAFAPGGVEVMAALAVETGLEPAFVAAHHVFRLLILTLLLPILMRQAREDQGAP